MSGAKANSNGLKFEDRVAKLLDDLEIKYIRNFPYKGIQYNIDMNRLDFMIDLEGKSIGMECKTQNTKGSVYEKVPLVMINGNERIKCDTFIALLDGVRNWNNGMVNWADEFAKDKTTEEKQLLVHSSFNEFQEWIIEQSESTGTT